MSMTKKLVCARIGPIRMRDCDPMTTKTTRGNAGDKAHADKERKQRESGTAERFPPLSISSETFLKDGTDRKFRHLIYSLLNFSALMIRHRECYASYIGVTGSQYSMVVIIADAQLATVGDVAEQMGVASQFVTGEISKLIEKDIIEKTPNEMDRRSILLKLTPRGKRLLSELGPIRRESNDLMYGSLTAERGRALQETIDKLIEDGHSALHAFDAPHRRGKKAPSVQPEMTLRRASGRSARGHAGRRGSA
jgi:MarR family transcriptional regulator, organic hydroperoxide resistance regulator